MLDAVANEKTDGTLPREHGLWSIHFSGVRTLVHLEKRSGRALQCTVEQFQGDDIIPICKECSIMMQYHYLYRGIELSSPGPKPLVQKSPKPFSNQVTRSSKTQLDPRGLGLTLTSNDTDRTWTNSVQEWQSSTATVP